MSRRGGGGIYHAPSSSRHPTLEQVLIRFNCSKTLTFRPWRTCCFPNTTRGGGELHKLLYYWILFYLFILFMQYSNASLLITRLMNYSLPNHKKISLPRQIFYPNFGIKRIYRHFFWNFIFYVQKTVILFRNCNFYVQNIQILWIIYICHFDNICEWFIFLSYTWKISKIL